MITANAVGVTTVKILAEEAIPEEAGTTGVAEETAGAEEAEVTTGITTVILKRGIKKPPKQFKINTLVLHSAIRVFLFLIFHFQSTIIYTWVHLK